MSLTKLNYKKVAQEQLGREWALYKARLEQYPSLGPSEAIPEFGFKRTQCHVSWVACLVDMVVGKSSR